jgi:hypothetical protein
MRQYWLPKQLTSFDLKRHVERNLKVVNFNETIITREQVEVEDKNFVFSLCEFSSFEKNDNQTFKKSQSSSIFATSQRIA